MLGHQLPVLPPFEQFWEEAELLFQWLKGDAVEEPVETIAAMDQRGPDLVAAADLGDLGPSLVRGRAIRTGLNHLLVELGYKGSTRLDRALLAAPQPRRRPAALRGSGSTAEKSAATRVDRIESAQATTQPFQPVFAIEFGSAGALSAPAGAQAGGNAEARTPPNRGSVTPGRSHLHRSLRNLRQGVQAKDPVDRDAQTQSPRRPALPGPERIARQDRVGSRRTS